MSFRRRAVLVMLILVPAAMWAIRGENPFLIGDVQAGPLTVYSAFEDDHSLPHGVDAAKLDAMRAYFEDGDFIGNLGAFDPASEGRAIAHPHGPHVCASGCSANAHPTKPLTKKEFHRLMGEYARQPIREDKPDSALEELLYFNRQTLLFMDRDGPIYFDGQGQEQRLEAERAAFLRRELSRRHVYVEVRVVDENGVIRLWNKPARVPMDIRHGFVMENNRFPQYTEPTGTVKRVGLYHLWQRI